jgi:PAS domain S-box-containing protein
VKGWSAAARAEIPISILLVDDHAENRKAVKAILSADRYRVVEAGSGPEALLRLLEEEFAVLLLDVVMPQMSGFDLARAVRERERTAAVPILFLTGQAIDVELVYQGYQVGAVDYLIKPLVPEMVRAKVGVFSELYRQRKRIELQAALLVDAERREGELRLLELKLAAERRYRNLAEAIPHIVWTAVPDGRVDYFNRRWFEYTGISLADAEGSWLHALHPEDFSACQDGWREALRSGKMFQVECRLRNAGDGEFRWHLCRVVPERGAGGEIVSWVGTFTDIVEQKRAQAAVASLHEKDTLVREVHHRVKNNLQVISSLLNLQGADADSEAARKMFRESQNRVHSMALVHERLYRTQELSRVALGEYVGDLVADLLTVYGATPEVVNVIFEVQEIFIEADAAVSCGLIVTELISNCLHHAFPGGRHGVIVFSARVVGEGRLELIIRDDGVGLPAGFAMHKVETLGLRMVRLLVEQLDGEAELAPAPGGGAQFRATLCVKHEPS